ncbi:MAG: hypothetical protein JOY71_20280 [Acetobacteraceae bacterium]|nr:hypothetical protein [Acetobacteraceae bacterium]
MLAFRRLMDDHAAADCIVGVLCHAAGEEEPTIFQRRLINGLRGAELVFAPNRQSVIRHLPAVARFLAKQNVFLLRIDVSEGESRLPGVFVRRARQAKYFKGDMDSKSTDYAYSELVYFDRD